MAMTWSQPPVGADIAVVAGLGHAHPGKQQNPAVVRLQGAGGVQVKAVVKLLEIPQCRIGGKVPVQREAAALMGVLVAVVLVGDALGATDEHRLGRPPLPGRGTPTYTRTFPGWSGG